MSIEAGIELLNYVLPVLRFLGIERVRSYSGPPRYEPEALRAESEGLRPVLGAAREQFQLDGLPADSFLIDVRNRCCGFVAAGSDEFFARWSLTPDDPPLPPVDGLSTFILGVWYAPLGHLVLADWLEENRFGPSALTTAMRESRGDPGSVRPPFRRWTTTVGFRWRWLAADVLLYLARVVEDDAPITAGFVLGLIHAPVGRTPRRWAHWLPDGEAARQLASEMGMQVPRD